MTAAPTPAKRNPTRERLIEAAFAVVAREGLEAASVKTIAAEAGITPGLMHYHFPTKDALLEAALRRSLEAYRERVRSRRAVTPPGGQLAAFFADARSGVEADADFFRVRLAFAAQALTHPGLAAVLRDLNAAATEETALTFAAAAGRSTPNDRDQALAATLKAAFDGVMLAWLNDPAFPLDAAGAILEDAAQRWLAPLP
ncbi:TetR family transcriptional regulator [Caulobacter sp. SLTY]|uniref:TetR/AcrR family transcriptional regulator n=1 Tax=Caulobacter sp. SLTY TaxID=2683262 RepID=UPI0014132469|nr:TetR family transcriptional regulator [Caulobacter sp. SLTY]NBB14493.1 TetR family transcriptional regulator [Caulobacter sp. SLTY]